MTIDERRGSSAQRGYGSRWQKARDGWLKKHPLCARHQALGKPISATVVDHIKPHKGDMGLFWDSNNWQSLCKDCHDIHKKRQEMSGRVAGCNSDGVPVDPSHHWNKQK